MSTSQFYFFAAILCLIAARVWSNHKELREEIKNPANAEKMKDEGAFGIFVACVFANWIHWVLVIAAARYFWLYLMS